MDALPCIRPCMIEVLSRVSNVLRENWRETGEHETCLPGEMFNKPPYSVAFVRPFVRYDHCDVVFSGRCERNTHRNVCLVRTRLQNGWRRVTRFVRFQLPTGEPNWVGENTYALTCKRV